MDKIKNKSLRLSFKKGVFIEGRKRGKRDTDVPRFPKIHARTVVEWIDSAISKMKETDSEMIKKAFKITGICPLLGDEELHDYDYIMAQRRRVVINRRNSHV